MLDYREIGKNIVSLRKMKSLTQEDLAFEADMSVSFLRDVEHGRTNLSLDSLNRIAPALNEPTWVLILLRTDDKTILRTLHNARQPAKQEAAM
jgi:transcriptional regulator with XRE-family HTH domain